MSHSHRSPSFTLGQSGQVAHHDGSPLFVPHPYPQLGDTVLLRVRVAPDAAVAAVHLRSKVDGDQRFSPCRRSGEDRYGTWWEVSVPMVNSELGYRFLLHTGTGALSLNARGIHDREVTDGDDFRLTVDPAPPAWARAAVFYEVFIDRYAHDPSGPAARLPLPGWATDADWDTPVAHGTPDGVRQLYRGDLDGITQHLDHLEAMGVTAIYLTPFFPATSNHRYDAESFATVDPLLGGDAALRRLTEAAHHRGIRVVGDLTLNHTGKSHEWFQAAQADPHSDEASYYLFQDHPERYETFADVPSMPKLDHRSEQLRRRLFDGAGSVVHRYLRDFDLDGWRIDVAQSAGHSAGSDRTLRTARATVATARAARTDAYVVAEHQLDASDALRGCGWHGTMAYASFTRPLWSWLAEGDSDRYWGVPGSHPPYTGTVMAQVMDSFNARIPWRSRIHSLNLLDSHDTPRLRSIVEPDRYRVAVGMLMTMPGIPMLFAGDEIGTHGVDPEDGRRPFRWDTSTWDHALLTWHQHLIRLRTHHPALTEGGFRWLHTAENVVVFERAHSEETLVVVAARGEHPPIQCAQHLTDLIGSQHLAAGDSISPDLTFGIWRATSPVPSSERD